MWPVRIVALLGCAEWLLIFRTWVSFRYLALYAGFAALRLLYVPKFLPHVDSYYLLLPISAIALLYHLRLLWRAQTSHNQQTYNTPEAGVPWLVIIARNPRAAYALECAVIVGFIAFMSFYGRLMLRGFQPATASIVAVILALWMPFSYALWNLAVSGVPLWLPRAARAAADTPNYVREENHTPPGLPSVRDLSDDLGNFYS
jgi:hypothetical protein